MGECAKTQVDYAAGDSGSRGRVWGGGSDVQWWGDFCQSNLDVNSVTVDFFSLTLEGDEDDGDADEGGTEI